MIRRRLLNREEVNYWPSLVDVMSSTAIILFFVMTIVATVAANNNTKLIEKNKKMVEDIQSIIDERDKMYTSLVDRLNKYIGGKDVVKRDETRLYVDTEILFVSGDAKLKPEGEKLADQMGKVFYQIIQEQKTAKGSNNAIAVKIQTIEVIGHADNVGDFNKNRQLSSTRSGNFVERMLSTQSKSNRLFMGQFVKSSSMSFYKPLAGTVFQQTDEQKKINRRIEFVINFSNNDFNYILEKYK